MTKTYILDKPPSITEQAKIPWEQIVSDLMSLRGTTDKCQEQMGEKAVRAKQMYGKEAIAKLAIECFIPKKRLYEYVKVVETFTESFRSDFRRQSFSHFRVAAHQGDGEAVIIYGSYCMLPEICIVYSDFWNWTVENLVMEIANSKPNKGNTTESVIYIDELSIEALKNPDCLSITATIFRNGGTTNGVRAIPYKLV